MQSINLGTISLVLGICAAITAVIMLLQKKITAVLIFSMISNAFAAFSNLCIFPTGLSGASICALAIIETGVSIKYEKKNEKVPVRATVIFIILYMTIGVLTYRGIADLLPLGGSILFALAIIQKNPMNYRLIMFWNSVMWIIYEITVPNYVLVGKLAIQLSATIFALFTVDRIIERLLKLVKKQ